MHIDRKKKKTNKQSKHETERRAHSNNANKDRESLNTTK
jgi:hypothetical protein